MALDCRLIWATTWMDEANECICPLLGLPALPIVIWPDLPKDDHDARIGLHWKTRRIVEQAAGLPFVWVDDETTDVDRNMGSDLPPRTSADSHRPTQHRPHG